MKATTRIAVILLTLLGCVGCDQATKSIARDRLPLGAVFSFLDGTVRLERAENAGAFLGLGQSLPGSIRGPLFALGGALLVAVVLIWAIRSRRTTAPQLVAVALLASGGVGNIIDRLTESGRVTDFLNIGIGGVRTGIFNVADLCLMIGLAMLILGEMRKPRLLGRG